MKIGLIKYLLALFVGFLIHSFSMGQTITTIPLVLQNVVINDPFYPSQTRTFISDTTGFRGIPSDLQAYQIKKLPLIPSDKHLFILYGITKENKRLVFFDANFDKDFSGEKLYLFKEYNRNDRAQEKAVLDSTSATEIRLPNAPAIYVKPNPFNCCFNYTDSLQAKWHLFVQTGYHREGTFSIAGRPYKMALAGSYSPYFKEESSTYFLLPDGQQFAKESDSNEPYAFKSPVILNGHEFLFDSLSRFGDTAWVLYKGYKEKAEGSRVGLYAQNIRAKTVSNETFDLKKLRGQYVLLDFWGTWCKPCIALLPELKQLHQKYSRKGFVLVSLAFDTKATYGKLLKMVKDHKMNWINVFDNQDLKANIANQYRVDCFPTSILISPEGKNIFRSCGDEDFENLKIKLAEAIK